MVNLTCKTRGDKARESRLSSESHITQNSKTYETKTAKISKLYRYQKFFLKFLGRDSTTNQKNVNFFVNIPIFRWQYYRDPIVFPNLTPVIHRKTHTHIVQKCEQLKKCCLTHSIYPRIKSNFLSVR